MSSRSQPFVARKTPQQLSWGPYSLDLTRAELLRDGLPVKLRPKSYETLKYLVLNTDRLISKTELISALWPDASSVSDDSVTHCIRDIRRALGDEDGQALIRTVPGRGYMFEMPAAGRAIPASAISPRDSVEQSPSEPARFRVETWKVALAVALLIILAAGAWFWKISSDRQWARQSVPQVKQLTAARRYSDAYDLAQKVLLILPSEPSVMRLMSELSDDLTVISTPSGASVSLRRMGSARVQHLGVTPIEHVSLARGEFIIHVRKTGYADFERTASSVLDRSRVLPVPTEIRINIPLTESAKTPAGMTLVPAGEHTLRGFSRTTDATIDLGDFWIDKFEVSNREFKGFVDRGGYNRPELWSKANSHAFRDKTALPGPRGWSGGTYPADDAKLPVTGVTWHEAAAYCVAQGKVLPTLFQWEKAARSSMHSALGVTFPWGLLDPAVVSKRANFESSGPAPVDSFEFGMSPYGAYNMAGNVAEWARNQWDDGYTAAGGAWTDPMYQFGGYGSHPAMHSAETLGFRCAQPISPRGSDGDMRFASANDPFPYPVSTEREFESAKKFYDYDRTPLHSKVISVNETETYRREEIEFDGYLGQRAKAYLYLPRNAAAPYQVIQFLSGTPWWYGVPITHVLEDGSAVLLPYVRSGRAVFLVVLKGFAGREPVGAYANLQDGSPEHYEILKHWTIDMRRAVDYLETRPDIDRSKIAFWNISQFEYAAPFAAVDGRHAANIYIGTSVYPSLMRVPDEVNPLFFIPHIRSPKLVMNGLYDDGHPISSAGRFFQLMREPKRREDFAGGHVPSPQIAVPIINGFLDSTMGPVRLK